MITKVIKLDINKNLYEKIKAKQGDTKSRFLLFQLLDGSMPFNLENRSVRAYMLKPDSTEVFNDLIINNRNTGHCTLELTNQVLAVAGIVKIELMIIENDKKITSSIFELQVDKSINSENSIVSTNEFNALLNGLASLSEYDNYKEKAKKVPELEENIQELGSQLDNIVNKVSVRRLKPSFGTSVFWADISANGDTYIPTDEQIINEIKSIEEMQVDTIIGSVHIGYKDGNLFLAENLSHLLPIVKTNLKNVKMTALKIHITRISKETITEMGETFKTQYKNLVSSILDNFKMFDTIKYVYHLNEMDWMYKDNNYHQFISELNTIVRNRGYKAGITNAGFYNIKFTPDVVYNSIDVIGINHYPALSFSGKEITKEEALNAWRNDNALGFCKELKKQFPNMEITITESGVMDYWIALSRPSYYSWTTEQKIPTGGKAPNIYLWGLLNTLNNDVVSNIWWLFDLNYPNETNNTINYFLRGGELNNDNVK